MSIKNECAIVRDLLPLYAEKMVCGETAEFVRDHLEGCASCRAELEQIGSGQSDEKEKNDEIPAEKRIKIRNDRDDHKRRNDCCNNRNDRARSPASL